jgi:hypothetical protein
MNDSFLTTHPSFSSHTKHTHTHTNARPTTLFTRTSTIRMTPELLLEVFRISWAKENAKKKRQKRLLEGGGIGRTENALRGRGDDDDDDDRGEDSDAEEMIITDEALIAANAVMNSFLKEVVHRAAAAAEEDGDSSVTGVHLERILPQLLLDFTS